MTNLRRFVHAMNKPARLDGCCLPEWRHRSRLQVCGTIATAAHPRRQVLKYLQIIMIFGPPRSKIMKRDRL